MTLTSKKPKPASLPDRLRDELIIAYAGNVRFVAQSVLSKLPSHIELDDLTSVGIIGLMDAIEKFDPSRDNKFKTYADFRIRGAILDFLRDQDWVPRSVRDRAKVFSRMENILEQYYSRKPTREELADAMQIPLCELYEVENSISRGKLVEHTFEEIDFDKRSTKNSQDNSPLWEILSKNDRETISGVIAALPDQPRLVISLYYFEQLNLKEIAKIMGVTESRASQIHKAALKMLKKKVQVNPTSYEEPVSQLL